MPKRKTLQACKTEPDQRSKEIPQNKKDNKMLSRNVYRTTPSMRHFLHRKGTQLHAVCSQGGTEKKHIYTIDVSVHQTSLQENVMHGALHVNSVLHINRT